MSNNTNADWLNPNRKVQQQNGPKISGQNPAPRGMPFRAPKTKKSVALPRMRSPPGLFDEVSRIKTIPTYPPGYTEPPPKQDDSQFSTADKATLKQAYAGLSSLILEAAKHDVGDTNLSTLLEDCKVGADRINIFLKIFLEKKALLQILLGRACSSLPHIIDVDWRLDYYIKNNHVDKVNEPTYTICLKVEDRENPGENIRNPGIRDVQFTCSMEQLQDLVGKLKDSTKSLEKFSQL